MKNVLGGSAKLMIPGVDDVCLSWFALLLFV